MAGAKRLTAPPDIVDYSRTPHGDMAPFNDSSKLDFAKLFPVPAHRLLHKGKKQQRRQQSPDPEDEGDDFWLSPRMACKLQIEAQYLADLTLQDFENKEFDYMLEVGNGLPCLPRVAKPFVSKQWWAEAYAECFNRLAARLCKGHPPSPNCTGEEMALHQLIHVTEELDGDGDFDEFIEHLPETDMDKDYDYVDERSVQDLDVLMLYDMRGVACLPNAAHLHPAEWFFSFQSDRAQDHLPGVAWRDPTERRPLTDEEYNRAHEEFERMMDAQDALYKQHNRPLYMPSNMPLYMPSNMPLYVPNTMPPYMPMPPYVPNNMPLYMPNNMPPYMPNNRRF